MTIATIELTDTTSRKYADLGDLIRSYGSVMIAYSGGVDSTLIAKVAHDVLGERAIAASGLSSSYAPEEIEEAIALAEQIGIRHIMVETMELTDPRYADNSHQRCYFCKSELYTKLLPVAAEYDCAFVLDGANVDDTGDFRPGMRAAREQGVRSPLLEVGLTKSEIRQISAHLGLPTWDKPAAACLSSRFAYGDPITVEKLKQVSTAETAIRQLGFRGFRVRHHDTVARLEFPEEQIDAVLGMRETIISAVKAAGYQYVTIDLEGYRTGSVNEVLRARLKPS